MKGWGDVGLERIAVKRGITQACEQDVLPEISDVLGEARLAADGCRGLTAMPKSGHADGLEMER